MIKNKKQEKGVTLLEVLAVVIIGILIVVGSFYLYNNISNQKKDSQIMSSVMALRLGINNVYGSQGTFGDNSNITSTLESMGLIPDFFKNSGGQIVSPYDTSKTILFNVVGSNNQFLEIGIEGVPVTSCIRLATRSSGYRAVGINNIDMEAEEGSVSNNPSPSVAATSCTGDDTVYYVLGVSN